METKLLPCPFCGGEAEVVVCDEEGNLHGDEYEREPWSGLSYRVFHPSETCPVGHLEPDEPKWLYDTKAEAIEAWNTRAERTCEGCAYHFWCARCSRYYVDFYTPKAVQDAD